MHCKMARLRKLHARRHERWIQLDRAQQPAHGILHAVPLHALPLVVSAQIEVMSLALRRRSFRASRPAQPRPRLRLSASIAMEISPARNREVTRFTSPSASSTDLFALRNQIFHPKGRAILHADRLHAQPVSSRRGKNLPREDQFRVKYFANLLRAQAEPRQVHAESRAAIDTTAGRTRLSCSMVCSAIARPRNSGTSYPVEKGRIASRGNALDRKFRSVPQWLQCGSRAGPRAQCIPQVASAL